MVGEEVFLFLPFLLRMATVFLLFVLCKQQVSANTHPVHTQVEKKYKVAALVAFPCSCSTCCLVTKGCRPRVTGFST
uniref:Uncharacterized protein n=1 Tax=Octopus bimaculoides TaxID=37653 RepID=A0A0L8FUR2_OCTBM